MGAPFSLRTNQRILCHVSEVLLCYFVTYPLCALILKEHHQAARKVNLHKDAVHGSKQKDLLVVVERDQINAPQLHSGHSKALAWLATSASAVQPSQTSCATINTYEKEKTGSL